MDQSFVQVAEKQAVLNISKEKLVTHAATICVTVILFSVKVRVRVNVEDSRADLSTVKPHIHVF